jgi:uncharacterized protein
MTNVWAFGIAKYSGMDGREKRRNHRLASMSENATSVALGRRIKAALEQHYGDRLTGVFLFGSRARGEHRPDSDLDVAVILKQVERSLSDIDEELLDLTYPLELEQGVHIQAWALPMESLADESFERAASLQGRTRLAAIVRRDGIPL